MTNPDGSTTYELVDKQGNVLQVTYDKDGYPILDSFRYQGTDGLNQVNIPYTGNRSSDFRLANQAAGFKRTPRGFTWHHHQNGTTMQLVQRGPHAVIPHTGGFSNAKH